MATKDARFNRTLAIGSPWPDKDFFKRLNELGAKCSKPRKIIKIKALDSPNVKSS